MKHAKTCFIGVRIQKKFVWCVLIKYYFIIYSFHDNPTHVCVYVMEESIVYSYFDLPVVTWRDHLHAQ